MTTIIAVVLFGTIVRQLAPAEMRTKLVLLGCLGLPLSPLAYFLVRLPLIHFMEPILVGDSKGQPHGKSDEIACDCVRLMYAPITEEPFKLLPFLALLVCQVLPIPKRNQVASLALTIGVSFAVGEFWLIAYLFVTNADLSISRLHWYEFGGYLLERIMTCPTHVLFALPTVYLSQRGIGWALVGLCTGMMAHYLGNAPIMLARQQMFGLSPYTWNMLLQLWLGAFVLVSMLALIAVQFGSLMLKRIWQNKMICPECGQTYRQTRMLGLNMGAWRYEPCGACKKWHWVTLKNLAPLEMPIQSIEPFKEQSSGLDS